MSAIKASNVLEFLRICGRLKTTKRTGWVNHGVAMPESVSDHMYRMGICSMILDNSDTLTSPKINKDKCVKMSIVHDLAESVVGDITPYQGVSKEDKFKMEDDAMKNFLTLLEGSPIAKEIYSLWTEYEEGQTAEALFVKDIDKFEMILQADEYEQSQGKRLDDFFASTVGRFQTPEVVAWVEELVRQRNERLSIKDQKAS